MHVYMWVVVADQDVLAAVLDCPEMKFLLLWQLPLNTTEVLIKSNEARTESKHEVCCTKNK